MHRIKKYANRKLYDMTEKQYISLDRLAESIRAGEEVEIIDNTTGEDITAATVSQVLSRSQIEGNTDVPPSILIQMIRRGGDGLAEFAKKSSSFLEMAVTKAEDGVEKFSGKLGKLKETTPSGDVDPLGTAQNVAAEVKKELMAYKDIVKDWINKNVDARVTERVSDVASKLKPASAERVEELEAQIEFLKTRLAELEEKEFVDRAVQEEV